MNTRRASKKKKSARDLVMEAMEILDEPIDMDDAEAAMEELTLGLDAVASTIIEWQRLPLSEAAPLDEVLAQVGATDDLVDAAGRLLAEVDGIEYHDIAARRAAAAEALRQKLSRGLHDLIESMKDD